MGNVYIFLHHFADKLLTRCTSRNVRIWEPQPCFLLFWPKHIACSLKWALKCHWGEGGGGEDGPVGSMQGRQQHLHTVEAGDWRSIISLCCYFKTGVSLSTGGHRVRDQTDSTTATSATPSTSAALHLSEQQRNNDQQRVNNKRKANLLPQIYPSFSTVATLCSDWCPLFWVVVWPSLTER